MYFMIYIILAHDSSKMLSLLIEKLRDKNNYFVIHIDQQQDIQPFVKAVAGNENCYFTPKRYASKWGSFALVEATLHAFDFITKKIKKNQRIVLLSGADLPIKSNVYINQYFEHHDDTIFIDYHPIPRQTWAFGGVHRFPLYEEVSQYIKFYGGSQWFSIPSKAINIIFKFLKDSPDFLDYFQYVQIPDESFFQTLFLNCEHPYILKNLKNQHLHYIKWEEPYIHPSVLTAMDMSELNNSKSLYARKFTIEQSSDILSLLMEDHAKQ
ncbi:beta-1,6-N-acetylglucosaminyltransferase [Sphingobacterium faecium]|uniref:beta-1,6-N-acetylglucosaminyltransferase n=1 Tax=Sphingobacterium faecium TaxID=34087 RepID=UPI00320B47B9